MMKEVKQRPRTVLHGNSAVQSSLNVFILM
jgi:hypothetical protein